MKKRIWIRILLVIAGLAILFAAVCAVSALVSARRLIVTRYELSAPLERPLRIVQLTDLHNREYGENNSGLIERVCELEPDFIMMTGDMINSDELDLHVWLDLIEALSREAPVYVCYGNHETSWMKRFSADLRPSLEEAGATVLEAQFRDIEWSGSSLRIGGYAGYYRAPVMTTSNLEQRARELQFADDFEATERYKILLDHVPTSWLDWKHRDHYPVDLVLCGHYHGGQVRLPLIGGLIVPNIGFFPPFTKGLYPGKMATVVLSAGLGSERKLPRINNPGEIVCIDLLPEK